MGARFANEVKLVLGGDSLLMYALAARETMLRTILVIVVILLLLGALPTWPYSAGWGYYPSGGLGLVLLIVVILVLAKKI